MSDEQFGAYEAQVRVAAKLAAEILPRNKKLMFDALAAAGIVVVVVNFDGSGDSGQFEEPSGFTADNAEVAVPQQSIEIETVDFHAGTIARQTTTLREFLEIMACDFLETTYSGWENGEGAYGEFRFVLVDRSIALEYNERYIECHFHEHQF